MKLFSFKVVLFPCLTVPVFQSPALPTARPFEK